MVSWSSILDTRRLDKCDMVRWNFYRLKSSTWRISHIEESRWSTYEKLYTRAMERILWVYVLGMLFLRQKRTMPLLDSRNKARAKRCRSWNYNNKWRARAYSIWRMGTRKWDTSIITTYSSRHKTTVAMEYKKKWKVKSGKRRRRYRLVHTYPAHLAHLV